MTSLLACLIAIVSPTAPSAEDILAAVSTTSAARREVPYSGVREYTIRNERFGKRATVKVQMTSLPGLGTRFAVIERTGATKLTSIIEKLLASESESTRPGKERENEIGPSNYQARLRGSERLGAHECYVLDLTPKSKSKYLVNGTVWIDKKTFGVVRLSGTTAASVSMWVGTPQILENFDQFDGIWLPAHLTSTSNSMLLGESGLEIHFSDYQVNGAVEARSKAPRPLKNRM